MDASRKLGALKLRLAEIDGLLIALSGGLDSSFLAKVAFDVLGPKAHAVTASSEIYAEIETAAARDIAGWIGISHEVVRTNELANPDFAENSPLRCYHCKQELFESLFRIAEAKSLAHVADGLNEDDRKDFRPGAKAARELGIISPLQDVALTKAEITALARDMGLPTWDKPPHPCLSTRFAYGRSLTEDGLRRVEDAEAFLRALGIQQFRLRDHDDVARLEVSPEDMPLLVDPNVSHHLISRLKDLGYTYVTLDLEGFRSGAMNEPLKKRSKQAAHNANLTEVAHGQ